METTCRGLYLGWGIVFFTHITRELAEDTIFRKKINASPECLILIPYTCQSLGFVKETKDDNRSYDQCTGDPTGILRIKFIDEKKPKKGANVPLMPVNKVWRLI